MEMVYVFRWVLKFSSETFLLENADVLHLEKDVDQDCASGFEAGFVKCIKVFKYFA